MTLTTTDLRIERLLTILPSEYLLRRTNMHTLLPAWDHYDCLEKRFVNPPLEAVAIPLVDIT